MLLPRLILIVGAALAAAPSLLLAGCGESSSECTRGTERCECYGNGTCEEGLVCLSDHCVDPTPPRDAGRDTQLPDAGDTQSGPSSSEPHAITTRGVDPSDETSDSVLPTDGHGSGVATTASSSDAPPLDTSASDSASADSAPATSAARSTQSMDDLSTESNTDDAQASSGEDTSSTHPPSIPSLPPRHAQALDELASEIAPATVCEPGLRLDEVCYEEIGCSGEPCAANFQWVWSTGSIDQATYSVVLRDASGDGTVLFGDWFAEGVERQAMLLRWGNDRATLIDAAESSATAINFNATMAVGAVAAVNGDWTFVRWSQGGAEDLPDNTGTPSDISDTTTIVGYERRVDNILWGFEWTTSADPTYAEAVALQTISGNGEYAGGVVDGSGQVVLFYDNGTKAAPPTPNFRPDATSDVNFDGSVVVGYGWSQQALKTQMYRWRVGDEELDIVPPLGDFQSSYPFGVTDDGAIVVGTNQTGASNGPIESSEAFYWDEGGGMRPMLDELSERGIDIPNNLWLSNARISSDGTTVVGEGYSGNSRILWRARLAR